MNEILRLIGYLFIACGILVLLYEVMLYFIEKEEGENL